MDDHNVAEHLSQMSTLWSVVRRAHAGERNEILAAQEQLLERYGNAIRRYLRAALGNADAVDEVFQEFAHIFLRGGFRGADPNRGRFRDYLKTTLYHLIIAHAKKQQRQPGPFPANGSEPTVEPLSVADSDREFLENWRKELLARAWSALKAIECETGRPFHTVLHFRAYHPNLSSDALATQLGPKLGHNLTATGVRQTLHRARLKFAALLVEEVAHSLDQPTESVLIDELITLDLLEYCKPVLSSKQA